MSANKGVYIKSHPMGAENKPHLEIHLTMTAKKEENPMKMLEKARKQLSMLVEENGGKAIFE